MYYMIFNDDAYSIITEYAAQMSVTPCDFIIAAIRNYLDMADKFIIDKDFERIAFHVYDNKN